MPADILVPEQSESIVSVPLIDMAESDMYAQAALFEEQTEHNTSVKPPIIIDQQQDQKTPEVWITVFVHGIMSIKPHLTWENFFRFMNDRVLNSVYSKSVELMREDEHFYWSQAMQGMGLQHLDPTDLRATKAGNAIARIYDEVSHILDPHEENYYYTFGWSGLLSPTQRYYDAQEFFLALEELVQTFKKEGKNPRVRVIGYSHGGNVALNLGAVRQRVYPDSSLSIDELFLLGVPILTETDYLVCDPLFKKIYNFTSPHDRIQQIDFFSFNRVLSRKYLTGRRKFSVPDKVRQVSLKFMQSVPTKKYDICNRSRARSKTCDGSIISGNNRLLRNVSPGHIELWFFGWSPQHYRHDFILCPLPVLAVLPYLQKILDRVQHKFTNPYRIIMDIRPEDGLVIIKQHKPCRVLHIEKFLSCGQLQKLADIAHTVIPISYTEPEFNAHIVAAQKRAIEFYDASEKYVKKATCISKWQVRMRMRHLIRP